MSLTPAKTIGDARLAAIIESSFDAIIAKDLQGIITDWNPAAERMFGHTPAEAIGQSILILIPDDHRPEETEIIRRIRAGERVESYETVRRRKDGRLITVSLTVSPIRNGDGEIVGASKIARDISAAKESEKRVRLLLREVNHRVKNQYTVILSIIRETARRARDPAEFQHTVQERISSLAKSHDLLVNTDWRGASLPELIDEQLAVFGGETRFSVSGDDLQVNPNAALYLGMAFHELGTNSSKYGVLGRDAGSIDVSWHLAPDTLGVPSLHLTWHEWSLTDRPNLMEASGRGFGSVVLSWATPQALGGTATFDLQPKGVTWTLVAPVESTLADGHSTLGLY